MVLCFGICDKAPRIKPINARFRGLDVCRFARLDSTQTLFMPRRDSTQTLRDSTQTRRDGTQTVLEIMRSVQKLTIGYNHKRYKREKTACEVCGARVRRDGMAKHRKSPKCGRKGAQYNHKQHNSRLVPCPICKTEVVWGKMTRHQRGRRCKVVTA